MFLTVCERLQFPAEATQVLTDAQAVLEKLPALDTACTYFTTEDGQDPAELLTSMAQ